MKKVLLFLALCIAAISAISVYAIYFTCIPPSVKKHMENWSIIATNTGNIPMTSVFDGKHLQYSISANPHHQSNIVKIDAASGNIKIIAEKKDNFDVTVTASNQCGKVVDKFNVEIDEEV